MKDFHLTGKISDYISLTDYLSGEPIKVNIFLVHNVEEGLAHNGQVLPPTIVILNSDIKPLQSIIEVRESPKEVGKIMVKWVEQRMKGED